MNTLSIVFNVTLIVWFLSEILYKFNLASTSTDKKGKDKNSLNILWITIFLSIFVSIFIANAFSMPILSSVYMKYTGLFLMIFGILARIAVIKSLGKFFTVDVTIREGHQLKTNGIYSILRHPSYAASLLTFLGLGLYLNNYLSLAIAFIPTFIAFNYRISIEETALIEQFGNQYREYMKKVKKLIPFIY